MLTRQTFYSFDPDNDDFPDGGTIVHYYYNQPVKDVLAYYAIRGWYWVLDIPFISKRVCRRAKNLRVLPDDCGLDHDHTHEPSECWWICPCVQRDLDIHYYRNKNAELIKDV